MNTVDMTKGSPIKLLLQFSIPILIGNLFQQAYTLADRIIVGRFVGDNAFSAIGATNALSMTFMSMCMGAAIGTGVVVSQYFGAKDEKGTAASIANGSYTCLIISIIMTLIALVTTKPILVLLNTPKSLMHDALIYMYIFMGGLIAVSAYFTPFSILRALGDSKTPLIFLVFCSLLNIVLDILFVVVFKIGVAGAAFATVLSEAIAAILCIIYAFVKVPQFKHAFHYRKIDKELIIKTFRVGVPTGLQYALIYVSSIILQRIVNGFGEAVIGAFTATTQIELLVQQIFSALGAAMVTYTGQNLAGSYRCHENKCGCFSCFISSVLVVWQTYYEHICYKYRHNFNCCKWYSYHKYVFDGLRWSTDIALYVKWRRRFYVCVDEWWC